MAHAIGSNNLIRHQIPLKNLKKVAYMKQSWKFYKKQKSSLQKSSLPETVMEILQKAEEYVEMKKLTLSTNKTQLIFFSRDNSDFGSVYYKTRSSQQTKVADIMVIKLTGILVSMSSWIKP